MAGIDLKLPIQVNLPDDWIEQIVNRLRNDPEAEWVEIVRCKDCRYYQDNNGGYPHDDCKWNADETPDGDDFCSCAERRTDAV